MTKEETLAYIKAYLDVDIAVGNIIPLRSVLESAIKYLSEPSLPSNLDEAAEKNFETMEVLEHENIFEETHHKIFKAGAECMAGQGVSMLGRVGIYGVDVESITKELREAGFNLGEEIILQIRKKQ